MNAFKNISLFSLLGILLFQLSGCTGVKHLSRGQKYYNGAEIKFTSSRDVEHKDYLTRNIEGILSPDPNTKILGSRPGVFFFHLAGKPKKEKGFRNWVKYKVGSEPVFMQDVMPERTSSQLRNHLLNEGYFNAEVEYEIKDKEHEGSVIYRLSTGKPYRIRKINYPQARGVYKEVIEEIQLETLLDSALRYQLEILKEEQKRIENLVENKGFYFFDDNYLIYEADSSVGDHQVDLTLKLDPNTPDRAKQIFQLDSIKIFPDYSVVKDTTANRIKSVDLYRKHTFINDSRYMRKKVLTDAIVLEPDSTYSHQAESYTLEHLLNLGTFKYVNIKFNQTDSALISPSIYMTPFPQKSIRLKLQAVSKSNNFVGPSLGIVFNNRNTFRGGELLEVNLSASYNIQVSGQNSPPLTAYELGIENTLTIPSLVTPFDLFDYHNMRFLPNTAIKLNARLQERLNVFRLNSVESGYGFHWRTDIARRHEFFPINISYVQLASQSESFSNRLETDPTLFNSLQDQFIVGATYNFNYNSKAKEDSEDKLNHYFLNVSGDIAGNILYGVQSLTGVNRTEEGNYELLNSAYSQYAKGQVDFRYYRKMSGNNELATRFSAGVARAYLNADQVPFIKQFSAGGSNDIRAFQARSLGPGAYYIVNEENISEDSILFFDETGDIKLLGNVEYRTQIIGVFKGAVFLDAGNIWLWDERKPGGEFRLNRFYQQIALGTGVGFRFDFSYFVLRFDLAFPLHNPRRPPGERWVIDEIKPLKSAWRRDNLILNIGIGYPF